MRRNPYILILLASFIPGMQALAGDLKEDVIYDFGKGFNGWHIGYNNLGKACERISVAPVPGTAKGESALKLDVNFPAGEGAKAEIRVLPGHRAWPYEAIAADILIPQVSPDGRPIGDDKLPKDLFGLFYIQTNQVDGNKVERWKNWAQAEPVRLVPGKWTTIRLSLAGGIGAKGAAQKDFDKQYENYFQTGVINRDQVATLGIFIQGQEKNGYKGPVYVGKIRCVFDPANIRPYVLENSKPSKSASVSVSVDCTRSGGRISPVLTGVNFGADIEGDQYSLKMLKDAGPGLFRTWSFGGYGNQVEMLWPAEGKYTWGEMDRTVKAIKEAGWEPLLTLGEFPKWIKFDWRNKEQSSEVFRKWAKFAADAVRHYNVELKWNIKYWEIWNETEIGFWGGSEKQYRELAKIACEEMKKADPSIKIAVGAWASPQTIRYRGISLINEAGAAADILSYHHYLSFPGASNEKIMGSIPSFAQGVELARKITRAAGRPDMPVMMSEANIFADLQFDPRINTSFWPAYWASALILYMRENVESAVFFNFNDGLFGMFERNEPRPIYYLWPLLNSQKPGGKFWLDTKAEGSPMFDAQAFRDDRTFSLLLVNRATDGTSAKAKISLKGVKCKELTAFSSSAIGPGFESIRKGTEGLELVIAPYSVVMLHAPFSEAQPEPSKFVYAFEGVGVMASGQIGQGDSAVQGSSLDIPHSWAGCGGDPGAVLECGGTKERPVIKLTSETNVDAQVPVSSLSIFENSSSGSKDCMIFKWHHGKGGDWGKIWWGGGIASGELWMPFDITPFAKVSFSIKSNKPGLKCQLVLGDASNRKTTGLEIDKYCPAGMISSEWQKAEIPLSDIKDLKNLDPERIVTVNFMGSFTQQEFQGDNIIFVDNVAFDR